MKTRIFWLGLAMVSVSGVAQANSCQNQSGCDAKVCQIEKKIAQAEDEGNDRALDGLQTALEETKKYCTDESLKEELQEKIEDTQQDIKDYQADILEAKSEQKLRKAKEYQQKLDAEKVKLKRLQNELIRLN